MRLVSEPMTCQNGVTVTLTVFAVKKTYVKQAYYNDTLLHLMMKEKLLTSDECKALLNALDPRKQPEIVVEILAYQNEWGGETLNEDELSDNDPNIMKMIKMTERQEQIKNQKCISGLVFVQTGDFEKIGDIDPYSFKHDFSDLKEYIEARGGLLRSPVSSKTDYLICNDSDSDTIKSRKARKLGIQVITEKEFMEMAEEKD